VGLHELQKTWEEWIVAYIGICLEWPDKTVKDA
jgi:hypothetical protein